MGTTPAGIWYPESGDSTRIWELMRQQAESIDTVVPVANVAARQALADQREPTPQRPLYVHRADAPEWARQEWTQNGDDWFQTGSTRGTFAMASNLDLRASSWVVVNGMAFLTGLVRRPEGTWPIPATPGLFGIPTPLESWSGSLWNGGGALVVANLTTSGQLSLTARVGNAGASFLSLDGIQYRVATS